MKVGNENKEKETIKKLILKSPTWSNKEVLTYQEAKNHFYKARFN